jgi:UV DNA damage repair endonuclease
MGGIDPQTKKYVGSDAVIKQQIAEVQADKKMKAEDKKEALANLEMAQKAKVPEVENKGNIDLVVKNYDKLSAALGDDTN